MQIDTVLLVAKARERHGQTLPRDADWSQAFTLSPELARKSGQAKTMSIQKSPLKEAHKNNPQLITVGCPNARLARKRITSVDAGWRSAIDSSRHNRLAYPRAAGTAPGPDCHSSHRSQCAAGAARVRANLRHSSLHPGSLLPACEQSGRQDTALAHSLNHDWQKTLARQLSK